MDQFLALNTDGTPDPGRNATSTPAESASLSQHLSHQYDNITLSDNSSGIFGNIVAQNVSLILNGEAQGALKTMIGSIMADFVQSKRQHKISKSKKQSSRHRHKTSAVGTGSGTGSGTGAPSGVEKSIQAPDTLRVADSRPSSQAERRFTRALLLRLGIYSSTRVHQIDDLPYMRITLRMARAIDAYLTNWTMTEGDRDVYREGDWKILVNAFHSTDNASTSIQRWPSVTTRQFSHIYDELSPQTLAILLMKVQSRSPKDIGRVARLSEHVLGRNHPVTFICRTGLVSQAFPLWHEIISHYVCDWIGRMILQFGSSSEATLEYPLSGPAKVYWRVLEPDALYPPFSDPELHASCLREAITRCSLVYRDDGYSINFLRLCLADCFKMSGNVPGAMDLCQEVYDKTAAPVGWPACALKADAAYMLGTILEDNGRECEAHSFYQKAIEWYHRGPKSHRSNLGEAIFRLHYLTSTYCGRDALESLMANYPQYWTLAQCQSENREIVLRDFDCLYESSSDGDSCFDNEDDSSSIQSQNDDQEELSESSDDEDSDARSEVEADYLMEH